MLPTGKIWIKAGIKSHPIYTLLNFYLDWLKDKTVGKTDCGISLEGAMVIDIDIADYVVILAETVGVLLHALD